MKPFLFLIIFSFGFFTFAEEPQPALGTSENAKPQERIIEPAKADYMMCKNGEVVRTIRIEKNKGICHTTYTKEGVGITVGKSGAESGCRRVFERIRGNLEKANWKCKDITQSRVSSSIE